MGFRAAGFFMRVRVLIRGLMALSCGAGRLPEHDRLAAGGVREARHSTRGVCWIPSEHACVGSICPRSVLVGLCGSGELLQLPTNGFHR